MSEVTVRSRLRTHKVRRLGGRHWRRGHGDDEGPSGSDPAPRSSTALVEILEVVDGFVGFWAGTEVTVGLVVDGFKDLPYLGPGAGVGIADNGRLSE
jgi:hypothetical protein